MFEYLVQHAKDIPLQFWLALGEMSPYLLFGFLVAGLLSVLVKPQMVERHLGGDGFLPVLKAAAFGVPLPLCSCGVIPVSASLRRHGASRGATTSFLLSTPQTGVDSILVTYSMLGLAVAVFRPITALVMGLVGGVFVNAFGSNSGEKDVTPTCEGACCMPGKRRNRIVEALEYGFVTLPQDLAGALIIGLVVAALIAVLIPKAFLMAVGTGIVGMFVMMAFGIPLYVCATASVPIAWALIAKGVSPGAALVFLITGPATNAATITTIWRVMGKRTAIIYLLTVALGALASGFILNAIDGAFSLNIAGGIQAHVHGHEMQGGVVAAVSSIALIAMLAFGLYRSLRERRHIAPEAAEAHGEEEVTELSIGGMRCSHCASAIERALGECPGVCSVDVDFAGGRAVIKGHDVNEDHLRGKVQELGYTVHSGVSGDHDNRGK